MYVHSRGSEEGLRGVEGGAKHDNSVLYKNLFLIINKLVSQYILVVLFCLSKHPRTPDSYSVPSFSKAKQKVFFC